MDVDDQVAAPGGARMGRLGRLGAWLPRLRGWLPRPAGIRNGGLLLVLVALAAVMALVDRPPEPVPGGRGGGIFQHLPPPVGISQLPPATPPGGGRLSALGGERPTASDRAHPRRAQPRPVRSVSKGSLRGHAATAPAGGGQPGSGGGGGSGSGGSGPPVATPGTPSPPVAAVPATRVRVAPVTVRVTAPPVLGRDLPEVRAGTPDVRVETPAVEVPRLRLG